MVSVSSKLDTLRSATAVGTVFLTPTAFDLITPPSSSSPVAAMPTKKGDVLTIAQLAGIMGAKHTSTLIPLCHPLSLTHISVTLTPDWSNHSILVTATAECEGKTGVEMEALTGATVACLTVWDVSCLLALGFERVLIFLVLRRCARRLLGGRWRLERSRWLRRAEGRVGTGRGRMRRLCSRNRRCCWSRNCGSERLESACFDLAKHNKRRCPPALAAQTQLSLLPPPHLMSFPPSGTGAGAFIPSGGLRVPPLRYLAVLAFTFLVSTHFVFSYSSDTYADHTSVDAVKSRLGFGGGTTASSTWSSGKKELGLSPFTEHDRASSGHNTSVRANAAFVVSAGRTIAGSARAGKLLGSAEL